MIINQIEKKMQMLQNKTDMLIFSGESLMKIVNKRGPRTDPCGTELVTSTHSELLSPMTTLCLLFDRKPLTSYTINPICF